MTIQNQLIRELTTALEEAEAHLSYCGYGDGWERECAYEDGLPAKLEKAIEKGIKYLEGEDNETETK